MKRNVLHEIMSLAHRKAKRLYDERGTESSLGEHETESCNEAKNSKVLLHEGGWFCKRSLWHTERKPDPRHIRRKQKEK